MVGKRSKGSTWRKWRSLNHQATKKSLSLPSPQAHFTDAKPLKWLKGRLTGKKQSVKEEGAYREASMEEAIGQGPVSKTQRLDLNPHL